MIETPAVGQRRCGRAFFRVRQVTLLTPVAITKDNLNDAERLGEVK